jgi:predicted Rdx family selenoprotein
VAELNGRYPDVNLVFDLVVGGGGIFDVTANGTLIYSKHAQNRFPMLGEVAGDLLTHL